MTTNKNPLKSEEKQIPQQFNDFDYLDSILPENENQDYIIDYNFANNYFDNEIYNQNFLEENVQKKDQFNVQYSNFQQEYLSEFKNCMSIKYQQEGELNQDKIQQIFQNNDIVNGVQSIIYGKQAQKQLNTKKCQSLNNTFEEETDFNLQSYINQEQQSKFIHLQNQRQQASLCSQPFTSNHRLQKTQTTIAAQKCQQELKEQTAQINKVQAQMEGLTIQQPWQTFDEYQFNKLKKLQLKNQGVSNNTNLQAQQPESNHKSSNFYEKDTQEFSESQNLIQQKPFTFIQKSNQFPNGYPHKFEVYSTNSQYRGDNRFPNFQNCNSMDLNQNIYDDYNISFMRSQNNRQALFTPKQKQNLDQLKLNKQNLMKCFNIKFANNEEVQSNKCELEDSDENLKLNKSFGDQKNIIIDLNIFNTNKQPLKKEIIGQISHQQQQQKQKCQYGIVTNSPDEIMAVQSHYCESIDQYIDFENKYAKTSCSDSQFYDPDLYGQTNTRKTFLFKTQKKSRKIDKQQKQNSHKLNRKNEEENEEEKRKLSLAQKNIKINFASGLRDFVKFKLDKEIQKNSSAQEIENLNKLYQWIKCNKNNFRSCEGWFNCFSNLLVFIENFYFKTLNMDHKYKNTHQYFLKKVMHLIIFKTLKYKKSIKANICQKLKPSIKLVKIQNYLIFTFLNHAENNILIYLLINYINKLNYFCYAIYFIFCLNLLQK